MKSNRSLIAPVAVALILTLAGCSTRSISDSGMERDSNYRGELSEMAVLGTDKPSSITESDIQNAIANRAKVKLHRGEPVVVVQSGARFPDEGVNTELSRYFKVVPLNGQPENTVNQGDNYWRHGSGSGSSTMTNGSSDPSLQKALRFTAARAGAKSIIVYWGILEVGRESRVTKTVSWVPILGSLVPDEKQQMRIVIKAAVIDVATGAWDLISPQVYQDEKFTAGITRHNTDSNQVATLKAKAYKQMVADLMARFG
ncbi:MAG: hypothetical protein SFY80_01985 [Verrucomicrobiota bacterium]|nr:hypothetical protein [Verrucomicrobiota bacterium]